MSTIWMRLGVNVKIPDGYYEQALLGDDEDLARSTLMELLEHGQYEICGESYIPAECLQDYNSEMGTSYTDDCDYEFEDLWVRKKGAQ